MIGGMLYLRREGLLIEAVHLDVHFQVNMWYPTGNIMVTTKRGVRL